MKPGFYLTALLPCLFAAVALFFLAVGLQGIVTKKTFLLSSGWLLEHDAASRDATCGQSVRASLCSS